MKLSSSAVMKQCSITILQQSSSNVVKHCISGVVRQCSSAEVQQCSSGIVQQCSIAAVLFCSSAVLEQCSCAVLSREFVTSGSGGGSVQQSEEDEHSLIAAYCRILTGRLQILSHCCTNSPGPTGSNNNPVLSTASILHDVDRRLDSLEQEAVEQMLHQLREENSRQE